MTLFFAVGDFKCQMKCLQSQWLCCLPSHKRSDDRLTIATIVESHAQRYTHTAMIVLQTQTAKKIMRTTLHTCVSVTGQRSAINSNVLIQVDLLCHTLT